MRSSRGNQRSVLNGSTSYCQFGKRFLDGFSWIAPVTNNRIGDVLNIEFVHEQLFFIEGERVIDDVGFSEKGKRFSEADMGKPVTDLASLRAGGYWLVGRRYNAEAARKALAEMDDGHYYSFFSNQCQDWADRLKRKIERIEKEEGLEPPSVKDTGSAADFWKEKAPTVPASALFGLLAVLLGIGACLAPVVAGRQSLLVLALFLIVSGVSEIIYAFHGRNWSQLLGTLFFAALNLIAGTALVLTAQNAVAWAGVFFEIAFGVAGLAKIGVALRSRPFLRWIGTLAAGLLMVAVSVLLLGGQVRETDSLFGFLIGLNLVGGGISTLWLRWRAARD